MIQNPKFLKIAALLPHVKLYGGIKRFFELGNQFEKLGHSMTIISPNGESPEWFNFKGTVKSLNEIQGSFFDAVFFTELSLLEEVLKINATRKIYYIVNPSVNLNKIKKHKEIEFFANSSNLLHSSKRKYGIDAYPALGGVNLANFHVRNREPLKPGDDFTVMAYGRIAEGRKGTLYVVKACERLYKKGYKVKLLLFDTPVTEKIQKAIEEFKTTVPYEFVLNHPVDKNVFLYHKADIFAAPEKKTGYANTVVEAMASGVPVVATSSGTNDLLFHNETGLLVTRNTRKIAKAILQLVNDPELYRKVSANARKNVEKLDWGILADRISQHLLTGKL